MDATASRRISEQHDRRAVAAMAPVIGDDGPEVSPLRASPSGIEDRGGGLVHEQPLGVGQMPTHPLGDRPEVEAGATGPVAQGGPIQGDPLAAIDIGLKRSEKHTSELQSLMRSSYAVF